ncbi:MAG: pseudaminic acid cytidylyltransferase [Shewanella sp.]|nr:pseudaminic acid cytidylyltransferase [Shewanella sp.]MCF1429579.1 pseudaminic acid cytidylyltransferase [Shewanella sp.]MCF1438007.1 pseudaminic acid cytidylyltransferase [Shewanella sp.]MCF1457014.1 pseudaminic acid cytidylyltransferase [Shewanella sp.]
MKIAVIPARGGSKRIPRKNIKLFHGKPIIAYSIEAALQSDCFDKLIVSTDDLEIAAVAREYGAEVPFLRPDEISDDYTTTMDVMAHAVYWCKNEGWDIEAACCIYATAPFVLPEYLQCGYELLQDTGVQFAFSATSFAFPIQRAIKLDKQGSVSMFLPENEQVRSQDLEEAYHDAGQFYWGLTNAFLAKLSIFSPHSKAVLLPRHRVQDIDTPEDWEFAESLFSALKIAKSKN